MTEQPQRLASRATKVSVGDGNLDVALEDGRTISVPTAWYPRLLSATAEELGNFKLVAGGEGIHWPDLDEDISVENLLAGRHSSESQRSLKSWMEQRSK